MQSEDICRARCFLPAQPAPVHTSNGATTPAGSAGSGCPPLPPCGIVYTLSDAQFERECRAARRAFLAQLRQYHEETLAFFAQAADEADALWKVSVRYNILKEACPRPMYPKDITDQITDETLADKDQRFSRMRSALREWTGGVTYSKLRADYTCFQRTLQPLKWAYPSALIAGTAWEKPLKWYVDRALDAMYYYECWHTHCEATFRAITLLRANESLDAYKQTLGYTREIEAVLAELLLFGRTLERVEAPLESVEESRQLK